MACKQEWRERGKKKTTVREATNWRAALPAAARARIRPPTPHHPSFSFFFSCYGRRLAGVVNILVVACSTGSSSRNGERGVAWMRRMRKRRKRKKRKRKRRRRKWKGQERIVLSDPPPPLALQQRQHNPTPDIKDEKV